MEGDIEIEAGDYAPAREAYENSGVKEKMSYEQYVDGVLSEAVRNMNLRRQNLCHIIA